MAHHYDFGYLTRRVQFAMALALVAMGFVGLILREDLSNILNLPRTGLLFVILSSFVYGTGLLLLLYLRGALPHQWRREEDLESGYSRFQADRLESALDQLRERVEALSSASAGMSAADKNVLVGAIRQDISGKLASEAIALVDEKYKALAAEKARLAGLRATTESTCQRLRAEIRALGRRGNLNLVIGTLSTLLAAGLLVYMVVEIRAPLTTVTAVLAYYVPRVTTVVFVEIFAFFFLRLYKASLADVKYYQNELTTIEMRTAAVETTVGHCEPPTVAAAIERLGSIDRNAGIGYVGATGVGWSKARAKTGADLPEVVERLFRLLLDQKKSR